MPAMPGPYTKGAQQVTSIGKMDTVLLSIGDGYDSASTSRKLSPFLSTASVRVAGAAGAAVEAYASTIRSATQLYDATHLNISFGARTAFGSAAAEFGVAEDSAYSSSSFAFVLNISVLRGSWRLKSEELSLEAKKLVDDAPSFFGKYGTHVVYGDDRSSGITVLATSETMSHAKSQRIAARFDAQLDGGGAQYGLGTQFDQLMAALGTEERFTFRLGAFGIHGVADFAKALVTDRWTQVQEALATHLASLDKSVEQDAQSYRYYLMSNDVFVTKGPKFDFGLDGELAQCYLKWLDSRRTAVALRKVVNDLSSVYAHLLPADASKYMEAAPRAEKYADDLYRYGRALLLGQVPKPIDSVELPSMPRLNVTLDPIEGLPGTQLIRIKGRALDVAPGCTMELAYERADGTLESHTVQYNNNPVYDEADATLHFETSIGPGYDAERWLVVIKNSKNFQAVTYSLQELISGQ